MNEHKHKSGYVALVGRPNVGKSTLLNRIVGTKLAAVTPRPQTTRNRIFGIVDREDAQIIIQDTPGLLEPKDALQAFMVREANKAFDDADVVIWMIDAMKGITPRELVIAENQLTKLEVPLIVLFNKIDKVEPSGLKQLRNELEGLKFASELEFLWISALYGDGVSELLELIINHLHEGPKFYSPDQLSDRHERFFVEELIREKTFFLLKQEIPYSLAVHVEEMKTKKNGMISIQAVLHVERESQKGILVGKNGTMIKRIGIEARKEIERMLDKKIFLNLWIKVSPKWRKKENLMKEFGYAD